MRREEPRDVRVMCAIPEKCDGQARALAAGGWVWVSQRYFLDTDVTGRLHRIGKCLARMIPIRKNSFAQVNVASGLQDLRHANDKQILRNPNRHALQRPYTSTFPCGIC
jgi:hypothetical protein